MNRKLYATEVAEDKVVGLMKVNTDKILEKDQKLSELDNRVDALLTAAAEFEQQAGKLKMRNNNVADSRFQIGGSSYSEDVGARSSVQSTISNKKLHVTQAKVDKAVEIMKVHVDKVLERDQRLSELDERVNALPLAAVEFEKRTKKSRWFKLFK